MKNSTPTFPCFHLQTLRRKPRSEAQKLADKLILLQQKSIKQIGEVFEKFIPKALLKPEKNGVMSRRRLFSKENTFWAFFSQVLDADGGCKEVIRKLQAYASLKGIAFPSSSTASYCTARKKLGIQALTDIFEHTARQRERLSKTGRLNNRRVIVVDGTGVSMPGIYGVRFEFRTFTQTGIKKSTQNAAHQHIADPGGVIDPLSRYPSQVLTLTRPQPGA